MEYFPKARKGLQGAWTNRREPEQVHALARAYWIGLLFFVAFVAVCATLYSVLSVLSFGGVSADNPSISTPLGPNLNREELKALAEEFSSREARYQNLKANPIQVTDPSK